MASTRKDSKTADLFRNKPTVMPEGYYSRDRSNPNLRTFVEDHVRAHLLDPAADSYRVSAFDKAITTSKDNAIYGVHGYWSKKPYDAIRQYISHFTKPDDLILDPFCGSGTTAIAASTERRHCVMLDLSGAATFITRHVSYPTSGERVIELLNLLRDSIAQEVLQLYATTCDKCGSTAEIAFTVWAYTYRCLKCLCEFSIYDAGENRECPKCGDTLAPRAPHVGVVPVETGYDCSGHCRPRRQRRAHCDSRRSAREAFQKYDLALITQIENDEICDWYPTHEFSNKWISYRPNLGEAKTIAGFFTKRNLRACATIMRGIDDLEKAGHSDADVLRFCFTAALLNFSRKAQHLEEGGGYIPGNYNFPPMSKERNVLRSFESVAAKVAKGMDAIAAIRKSESRILVSTQSALDLSAIPTNSVDYIFTDPPYSNKVPFGEFNFLYEAWLKMSLSWKSEEEVIQNEKLGKSASRWSDMMTQAASEMFRVLKPGRWASVCYHDAAEGSWELLQDAFTLAGFVPDDLARALSIEVRNKSFKQRTTSNVQKRDLVINFRKPRADEIADTISITGDEDARTFREKVQTIVRDYLGMHPGATKDRVLDEVVSRMVRAGQMEAHNFDEILRHVAQSVGGEVTQGILSVDRWYLKDDELDMADATELAVEDAAASIIRAFITKRLKENAGADGVHYSEVFEHYIYAVKDKTRRPLVEWLLDYFYKTDSGTYRLPANSDEERVKTEGRAKGLNRRVKRYLAWLEQGVAVPENGRPNAATLAEWIHHCRRNAQYEQGKLLYEKGGLDTNQLSDEAAVVVDEDYQVCVRMLDRSAGSAIPRGTRGRKKRTE